MATKTRSEIMRAVRQKDTKPEIIVRKILHGLGFRFRLHRTDLPGTPDIVLRKYKTAIFVHGCFWHRHEGCRLASTPKTRQEYWLPKFEANVERDARKIAQLQTMGWQPMVIWECETRDLVELVSRLTRHFLGAAFPEHD